MMEGNENLKNLPIVSVRGLSKKFCRELNHSLWYGVKDTVREFFFRRTVVRDLREKEFWALKDVSFELRAGESLAIIGANGVGKSTLLKILYGLIKPDGGEVRIRGQVGALIELGAAFDQVLSGRENIYINASLLGFPNSQMKEFVNKVINFSELGDFIDTPVQYYSSGMVARLAYSIAANMNPAIFLVDEVLAVGDMLFRRKCINQMLDYLASGGSLILVSHDPFQIQAVCQHGIFLEDGKVAFAGSAIEALSLYHESRFKHLQDHKSESKDFMVTDEHPVIIEDLFINSVSGEGIKPGEDIEIIIKYRSVRNIDGVGVAFMIYTQDNLICIAGDINNEIAALKEGVWEIRCLVNRFPLLEGKYLLKVSIFETSSYWVLADYGFHSLPLRFTVESELNLSTSTSKQLNQLVMLDAEWQ